MLPRARRTTSPIARRRGFTLAEASVTTFLMVLLGMLMATTVVTFARPSADVDRRAQLAIEANLAAESLAYDLGGYLASAGGSTGNLLANQAVHASEADPLASPWSFGSENRSLSLSFTSPGDPSPVVTTVVYQREGSQLTRTVAGASPSSSVVAGHVAEFSAYPCEPDGSVSAAGKYARIVLALATDPTDPEAERSGNCSATFVLIGVPPP